jgi:hypothetical protein
MAKKQTEQAAGPVEVRALMDDPGRGLRCGQLATVDAADLQSLLDAGLVDDHPDAVAYAKTLTNQES